MSSQSPPVAYTLQSECPWFGGVPMPEQHITVISAEGLSLRRISGKEPNTFIKGTVEGLNIQTKVQTRSTSPEWKEAFQM